MLARRLALALFLAALLVLSLVAGTASADQEVKVELNEFNIVPKTITVAAGEKVRFAVTNTGAAPHDLHIEGQGVVFEVVPGNANIAAGQSATAEFTFGQAGTYVMWCPVGQHRQRGMEGTFVVAAGALAPGATGLPRTGEPSLILGVAAAAGGTILTLGWFVRRRSQ